MKRKEAIPLALKSLLSSMSTLLTAIFFPGDIKEISIKKTIKTL